MRKIGLFSAFSILIFAGMMLSGFFEVPRVSAETQEQIKARLEQELAQYEAEIKQKEAELAVQKQQSGSLQSDINILVKDIANTRLKVKARILAIQNISEEIDHASRTIRSLSDQLENQRESLAQLVRKTDEFESSPIIHLLVSKQSMSDFYGDIDSFESIQQAVKKTADEIKRTKGEQEVQKQNLMTSQEKELNAKADLEAAQRKIEKNEAEKKSLLSVSQSKEKTYQQILADRRAKAAQIRAALFSLRDSAAIPFGKALDYAISAEKKTGVRPAFLLAIMTQESNLGQNIGTCYVTDLTTGAGVGSRYGTQFPNVMKPVRDIPPFVALMKDLGRDPLKTLVSCPIASAGGYGGAMGPAQFIPSTWALYKARLASELGVLVPDPWNPAHAFMASSTFLADLGAGAKTYTAECNAASRYYSGRPANLSTAGAQYCAQVMAKATSIQENQIDLLQNL